jgi:hypothetical protein
MTRHRGWGHAWSGWWSKSEKVVATQSRNAHEWMLAKALLVVQKAFAEPSRSQGDARLRHTRRRAVASDRLGRP